MEYDRESMKFVKSSLSPNEKASSTFPIGKHINIIKKHLPLFKLETNFKLKITNIKQNEDVSITSI
jgi:hypothetical protein